MDKTKRESHLQLGPGVVTGFHFISYSKEATESKKIWDFLDCVLHCPILLLVRWSSFPQLKKKNDYLLFLLTLCM